MKRLLIIIILAASSGTAIPGEHTDRDIAVRMDAVDTSLYRKRTAIMVINCKGQKLVRRMETYNKKYGSDERSLIKFIERPDVRGIMYLTWSYEDIERDDAMWVFLPAESLVRRISGGGKKGLFEDIEKREVDDDEHRFLRSEEFSGVDCYVVERISEKQKDTN